LHFRFVVINRWGKIGPFFSFKMKLEARKKRRISPC
jgi:hypothetical protein